jgi:hypothetical protein
LITSNLSLTLHCLSYDLIDITVHKDCECCIYIMQIALLGQDYFVTSMLKLKKAKYWLVALAYQPVLPHGLVRININIRLITNNYNYLSDPLFHLLNILMYNTLKIHTHQYIVVICLVSNNIFYFVSHLHIYLICI